MKIGLFGLGEAGGLIAHDLAAGGLNVHAYDPAKVTTPDGVIRHDEPAPVVLDASLVMGITAAKDAHQAMTQAWDGIGPGSVYADLATAAPQLERQLAAKAADKKVLFADVALMAPVPGRGVGTPALASGTGAETFARILNSAGGRVQTIGGEAGRASARKLMRSVVTKGLTALLIEAMESAETLDEAGWLWEHLTNELADLDTATLHRLLEGTGKHAVRRLEEMRTAEEFLVELGVEPAMTRGTAARLGRVISDGMPDILLG